MARRTGIAQRVHTMGLGVFVEQGLQRSEPLGVLLGKVDRL